MANSPKLLAILSVLVSFLIIFTTTKAQNFTITSFSCPGNSTAPNSALQSNLKTLLIYLSSNATANKEFHYASVTGRSISDSVYGLYMCRGDVPPQRCRQCISKATDEITVSCYLSNEAIVWFDQCMLRYSNRRFIPAVYPSTAYCTTSAANMSSEVDFSSLLVTMNRTANEAASGANKYYATKEAKISKLHTLYSLAQCTQNLSPQECSECLSAAITAVSENCKGLLGCTAQFFSCTFRYEVYPFYRPNHSAPFFPSTNSPNVPHFSDDPVYYNHYCWSNKKFDPLAYKEVIVDVLFPSLSFQSTRKTQFYGSVTSKSTADEADGLFMCRGDISPQQCHQCVLKAIRRISSACQLSKEAIIWYDQCTLRYSDQILAFATDTHPRFTSFNTTNHIQQSLSTWLLGDTLAKVVKEAQRIDGNSEANSKIYATRSVKISEFQTLYTLAQCSYFMDSQECRTCLEDLMGNSIPWCCLGSGGGRVLCPSCNLRFELFPFYRDDGEQANASTNVTPHSPGPTEKRKHQPRRFIIIVVPILVAAALLSCFGCYLLRKKARKSYKTILEENFGQESATLESLQFNLATIEAATNNFSHENRIGKGGFGEVYKGTLPDGRHIAVKRLSISSKQGAVEFRNEVLLMAKLQHRNLVALIGFCLEDREKILIYEYVVNKSLDYFLFDTQQQKLLNWSQRYKIIGGIAGGILYLHEYSRLKIIHRDLKPSNILLDDNMNQKISDFGMARIVEIDQDEGNTHKIAGTYGYMSPEYAMLGQFSEKSDVFSFGVMVIEIITGKKNASSHESHYVADGLLSNVWKNWRDQTPLSILDPNINEDYSQLEVTKCIQIGLLCVQENPDTRPTMATVVSYLSNDWIELPNPQKPAYFIHNRMAPRENAYEANSDQCISNFTPFSVNEMSTSKFLPR